MRPRPWDSPGKNTGLGCHFLLQCMKVKSENEVTQSCLMLRDSMDHSLTGSSIHGIFQARVLEWGAIAFSVCLTYYQYISYMLLSALKQAFVFSKCLLVRNQGTAEMSGLVQGFSQSCNWGIGQGWSSQSLAQKECSSSFTYIVVHRPQKIHF